MPTKTLLKRFLASISRPGKQFSTLEDGVADGGFPVTFRAANAVRFFGVAAFIRLPSICVVNRKQ